MLLVIMGHCIYFCMYHEQTGFSDPAFSVICSFHVPLFFFLSGFVIAHPPTFRKFLGKARRFMVPMLVVGFVNALLISRVRDFFIDGGHNGYWYLLTLTVFYLLLMPFRLTEKLNGFRGFMADGTLAIVIWGVLKLANQADTDLLGPFNPWGAFAYWPFFILAYIGRKYKLTAPLTDGKPWMAVGLVAIYLALLIASFDRISDLPLWLDFTIAVVAIAALVAVFHPFSHSNTFADCQLQLIGNRTLDIYVYHYFFIRFIDLSFLRQESLAAELALIFTLTVAVAYGSIAVGAIVRHTENLITKR